jgi:hypothetical protein
MRLPFAEAGCAIGRRTLFPLARKRARNHNSKPRSFVGQINKRVRALRHRKARAALQIRSKEAILRCNPAAGALTQSACEPDYCRRSRANREYLACGGRDNARDEPRAR